MSIVNDLMKMSNENKFIKILLEIKKRYLKNNDIIKTKRYSLLMEVKVIKESSVRFHN